MNFLTKKKLSTMNIDELKKEKEYIKDMNKSVTVGMFYPLFVAFVVNKYANEITQMQQWVGYGLATVGIIIFLVLLIDGLYWNKCIDTRLIQLEQENNKGDK